MKSAQVADVSAGEKGKPVLEILEVSCDTCVFDGKCSLQQNLLKGENSCDHHDFKKHTGFEGDGPPSTMPS